MKPCRFARRQALIGRRWQLTQSDRGTVSTELVLLVPALMAMTMFVVYAGRISQAETTVRHAADQAARAASQSSAARWNGAATSTAAAELARGGAICAGSSVSVSESLISGVRALTVTVSCTVDRSNLAPLAPGSQTLTASSTEVIDLRRVDGKVEGRG